MPLTSRRIPRRPVRTVLSAVLAAGLALSSQAAMTAQPGPEVGPPKAPGFAAVTPGAGPVSVSVVVPIVVSGSSTGFIDADDLARYTDTFGSLTRLLDAVDGTAATLAIDPMILASIRVLGSAAPDSARLWLARLEALPNESFLLGYGDADVLIASRTGTLDALTPSGFGFALDASRFSEPGSEPTPSPTPTETGVPGTPFDPANPDPGPVVDLDTAPPFPTTDDVLAWASTLPSIAWPARTGVGASDIVALTDAGYGTVLLSDADATRASGAHVTIEERDALVADAARSQKLTTIVSSMVDTDRAQLLAELTGDLTTLAASAPGRSLVLTLDRVTPGTAGLLEALTAIEASEAAQLVSLGDVLASPASAATLGEPVRDADREAVFTELVADVAAETAFATVLVDPRPLLDPRSLERIALYGVTWLGDPAWTGSVTAFQTRSTEILDSIHIERGSDLVLLARNTGFRVAVSNALDLPVTVRVTLDPRSPLLRAEGTVDLTIEPNATASAYVPVEAIANGEVRVFTSITSPAGVPLDSGFANITVRAEWETVGTLVFVLGMVVVFAAGIIRLIVKRRKARAEAAGD